MNLSQMLPVYTAPKVLNLLFTLSLRRLTLSQTDCYSQNIDKQRERCLLIRPQSFL